MVSSKTSGIQKALNQCLLCERRNPLKFHRKQMLSNPLSVYYVSSQGSSGNRGSHKCQPTPVKVVDSLPNVTAMDFPAGGLRFHICKFGQFSHSRTLRLLVLHDEKRAFTKHIYSQALSHFHLSHPVKELSPIFLDEATEVWRSQLTCRGHRT